jgi:diguanylate cyclase (GGDEF)-like protein/PAS domain S-box-containing protein
VSSDSWFDLAPCGLVATSSDGTVLEANSTFLEWTGHSPEIIGTPFADLLDPGSRLFYETRHVQSLHLQGRVDEAALTIRRTDGHGIPVLVNSLRDAATGVVRTAVFNATERVRYERDLVHARRAAESSEARVRVLQEVSSTFGLTASAEDVAHAFADVARTAFSAREAAVLLWDDEGDLVLAGGVNPLAGRVPPVVTLRNTPRVVAVSEKAAQTQFPELAAAMRETRLEALSVTPLLDESDRLGVLVCFFGRDREFDDQFYDLQQALGRQASQTLVRLRYQRRLAFLALHDQLTGVGNRQLLEQSLDDAIRTAWNERTPLAVLFLDVDDFKSINDRFGHAAGDMVLTELAARLTRGVRAGDVVGRIGGDEFVAICADADQEAAEAIAERILAMTQDPITVDSGLISPSVSVGVSLYRPQEDPRPAPEHLLVRADGAMYESKGAGKNRVTIERLVDLL